jgi:cytochrome c biogenesis protein CcmG, thiol:disulfide interchange protein DsbE
MFFLLPTCVTKAVLRHGFFMLLLFLGTHTLVHAQEGRWTSSNQAAPKLILPTLAGQEIDLASYKGRIVIVNFWATWCGPCVAEMPSLQTLAARLGEANTVVLGVNYHESPQKIRDFQAKHDVRFPLLRDPWHNASADWGVRALPATFIIDREGKLRYTVVGEVDWLSPAVAARLATLQGPVSPQRAQTAVTSHTHVFTTIF